MGNSWKDYKKGHKKSQHTTFDIPSLFYVQLLGSCQTFVIKEQSKNCFSKKDFFHIISKLCLHSATTNVFRELNDTTKTWKKFHTRKLPKFYVTNMLHLYFNFVSITVCINSFSVCFIAFFGWHCVVFYGIFRKKVSK